MAERTEEALEADKKDISTPARKKERIPLNLGIAMTTGTKEVMQSMGLPPLNRKHPIVTEVKPGSYGAFAGFRKKDIILKVNGWQVQTTRDVERRLSKNRTNTFDVLRYRPYSRQYISMIFQIKVR